MDFLDEVKEFLNNQKKEKGEATANTYRSKIYAFYEFVSLELREVDATYIFFLNVMDKNKLLQSVEYYVKAGNLKSRAAVDIYYTVLGNFYKFLSNKYGKTNDYFQDSIKKEEFKEAFESKIKQLRLRDSDMQEPIGRETAEKVLEECNKLIDGIDIEKILRKEKGVYSNYISSLIVKLVLIYGLKNEAIRKLKIKDYNDQLNDLIINNYRVRLPDGLAIQMKKYKEIRKRFLEKYGIESLEYCQEQIDAERGLSLLSEKSRILDSALRKNILFDDM